MHLRRDTAYSDIVPCLLIHLTKREASNTLITSVRENLFGMSNSVPVIIQQ